ncbi:MAG: TetR/AcrR family transcriptional regulator [Bacteroidetes bacterium]|nr:TetR/AcrR family transcriptional regulator [Bacteroidota bacterium]
MITQEQIANKCLYLFYEKGMKISTDEISRSLGISKRTLYSLFSSKTELLTYTMNYVIIQLNNKLYNYISNKNLNVLEKIIPIKENKELNCLFIYAYNLLENINQYYPEISINMDFDTIKNFSNIIIDEGISEGIFRTDFNKDILIDVLYHTIKQIHLLSIKKIELNYTMEEYFYNTMWVFLRGITTPYGLKLIDEIIEKRRQKK